MSTKGMCANCRMKGKPLRKISPMVYDMKVVREGQRDGKIGQVRWLQKSLSVKYLISINLGCGRQGGLCEGEMGLGLLQRGQVEGDQQ